MRLLQDKSWRVQYAVAQQAQESSSSPLGTPLQIHPIHCKLPGSVQAYPQPLTDLVHGPQDKSWRVRYAVAQQLPLLSESLGPARTQQELLPSFVALLKDSEAEVRVAAATRVASFCKLIAIDQVPACSCWDSSMDIQGRGGWINIMADCALL